MVSDQAIEELEREMVVLVRRIRRVIAERAKIVHPDMSAVAYSMLNAIQESGPLRATTLVDMFSIDKGAVSRQVQSLLDLGMIARVQDPEDRRAAILTVTDEGRRRLEEMTIQRRQQLTRRMAEWTDEDLRSFIDALARYNRTIGDPVNR